MVRRRVDVDGEFRVLAIITAGPCQRKLKNSRPRGFCRCLSSSSEGNASIFQRAHSLFQAFLAEIQSMIVCQRRVVDSSFFQTLDVCWVHAVIEDFLGPWFGMSSY